MAAADYSIAGVIFDRQDDRSVIVYYNGVEVFTIAADGSLDLSETVSGDATISSTGTLTLADESVDSDQYVDGSVDNVHLAGSIERDKLLQEAAELYPIPLHSLRAADGATLGVADTEDSGDHYLVVSSNTWALQGNSPNSDTQTDVSVFQFALPPEYDDGETITLRVNGLYTADGDTKTLDAEVYLVDQSDGSVGSDICATGIKTLTASAVDYDFTVTPTSLVGGDLLNVKITTAFEDSDGTDGEAKINAVSVVLDVKG